MENQLDKPLREVLAVMQARMMTQSSYFGIPTLKNPTDAWIYQEIIFKHRPDAIIEVGNYCGGSTLALAHQCDLMNHGRVIGLDIDHSKVPAHVSDHSRITLFENDACQSLERVKALISADEKVMLIEDSSHSYENTLNVLNTYAAFVKPGDYIIVEDSICYHGIDQGPNPGPYEAIEEFVRTNPHFVVDREKESFLITWNPKGFLRCVGANNSSFPNLPIAPTPIRQPSLTLKSALKAIVPPILVTLAKKFR